MADRKFGYVLPTDRFNGMVNTKYYRDFDAIQFGDNPQQTFNHFMVQQGITYWPDYPNHLLFKIGDSGQEHSDWQGYTNINWSYYIGLSRSIHICFDAALFYQVEGCSFDYDNNQPDISSTSDKDDKYLTNQSEIQKLKLNDFTIDYQEKERKNLAGFGYLPKNLNYQYIDGAFNSQGNLKPLEERMIYELWYNKDSRILSVTTKKPTWRKTNSLEIYSTGEVNVSYKEFHFDEGVEPIICICECLPADDNKTTYNRRDDDFSFIGGKTNYYYINCAEKLTSGARFVCSDISVASKQMILTSVYTSREGASLSEIAENPTNIVYFTAPKKIIGNFATISKTVEATRTLNWTLDWQIDATYGQYLPEWSTKRYLHSIPDFYSFCWSHSAANNITNFIDIKPVNYLLYYHSQSEYAICATKNNQGYYNIPGLQDFNIMPTHQYWNDKTNLPGSSFNATLVFDRHPLYLMREKTSGTSNSKICLPIKNVFRWANNVDNIHTNTPHETYNTIKNQPLSYWQDLQNTWMLPTICLGAKATKSQVYNKLYLSPPNANPDDFMNPNKVVSLYNLGRLQWNFASKIGLNSKGNIGTAGMYFTCLWKNTTSINCNGNIVNDQVLSNTAAVLGSKNKIDEYYNWSLLRPLPTYREYYYYQASYSVPETNEEEHILNQLKDYSYAYPQSSQAPGAIAIFAVTW